jgi:para-nitrobenzyl esterase
MIIGNTHDETRAFLGGDPKNFTVTWEELPDRLGPSWCWTSRRRWW